MQPIAALPQGLFLSSCSSTDKKADTFGEKRAPAATELPSQRSGERSHDAQETMRCQAGGEDESGCRLIARAIAMVAARNAGFNRSANKTSRR